MVSLVAHNKLFYCFTHFSNCHLKIYAIKLKLVLCPVTGTKKNTCQFGLARGFGYSGICLSCFNQAYRIRI